MKKEDFLEVIKSKREVLKYSQAEIAAKLGIQQSQYGKLENGKSEMTLEKFVEICNILNLKISDFDNEKLGESHKEEIINKIKNLLNDL